MLVSEVLNTKAIALYATEDASNNIPYLGLRWFPEKKKQGLDLKWIKTHKGLPISLKASNFDAIPELRAREGLKEEHTQMAFFREGMQIDETLQQEIDRVTSVDDPYLESALNQIYDDANNLVAGARVVPERMRMQLLATVNGHPMIVINSGGAQYSYDYDPDGSYALNNYVKLSGTSVWSDHAKSKPLTDLTNTRKKAAKKGIALKYALMTTTTFADLLENDQIKNAILVQNPNATIELTDSLVTNIIQIRTGLTVVIYDKMYMDENKVEHAFFPDNKVALLPEGTLGNTWYGVTPEERTARQVADVDVTMYGNIAIAKKVTYGPPAKTEVFASEIVLPSYENMDSVYVLETV